MVLIEINLKLEQEREYTNFVVDQELERNYFTLMSEIYFEHLSTHDAEMGKRRFGV